MKAIIRFIKDTLVGGILLMVPLVFFLVVAKKALSLLGKMLQPVAHNMEGREIGGVALELLVTIFLLLLLCFLAGLFMKTATARRLKQFLENNVLIYVPGYSFVQALSADKLDGSNTANWRPAVFEADDNLSICFITDETPTHYSLFVPGAPTPSSGSVVVRRREEVRELDISFSDVTMIMKQFGKGAAAVISG